MGLSDYDLAGKPWRVEKSEHVHRDRWISVRSDTCVTHDGVLIDPYYVLEYSDWVAVVAIDRSDQVLLVEEYRHAVGRAVLGLPGGGIERFDSDAIAAAQRELREETGFEADRWRSMAQLATNPSHHDNWCHIVLAEGAHLVGEPKRDATERLRWYLHPIENVIRMARCGEIAHGMDVAALALALSDLGRW